MIAIVEHLLTALPVAGLALVVAVVVARVVGRVRRHRPLANRRFLARYRAEHPIHHEPPVEPPSPGALPVIRSRTQAGGDRLLRTPSSSTGLQLPRKALRMIDNEGAGLSESQAIQRLADLRDAGGWHFTIQKTVITAVRPWPDGSADLLILRNFTSAQARRTNPTGGVVWCQEGSLEEIADALLTLPAPEDPRAPTGVIAPGPDRWTSG